MYGSNYNGDGDSNGDVNDEGNREHWEDNTVDCTPKIQSSGSNTMLEILNEYIVFDT